jgi:hemolysin activation/secretion protein
MSVSRVVLCALFGLSAASGTAVAGPPNSQDQSAKDAAATPDGRFQLPDVAPPSTDAAAASSETLHVERIAFRGNKALRTDALQAVAAPYLARDLTAAQIEELRILLTRQYTDRGYVNSGVILDPTAPYRDGILSFQAVEGRIKAVRVRGQKRLRPAYVVDRLQRSTDETLNINVLRERFQRLLDDPLFARINSRILPGEELGEAILDLDVERARPYALSVALNNYRPPSIGEKGYDVAGQVRDLTGAGDLLDADISGPIGEAGGFNYDIGWQIPFNRYDSRFSIRTESSETVVTEEPLAALDIRSKIERQELWLTQPLWASLVQQFNVGVGIAFEKNTTALAGMPFSFLPGADAGETRSVTARFAPDYSYRSENQYLGLRVTLLRADLVDETSNPVGYVQPDLEYHVWTGQARHLIEFRRTGLELESRATIQRTGAHISDLHAIEIGGINSVRGFRENELLVANVENLNIDLRWLAIPLISQRAPGFTVGTFFDWAHGYDVGAPATTLSSCGVTFRMKWPHVQADLAVGARLIHPSFVDQEHGSWQDHGIHAQIATQL